MVLYEKSVEILCTSPFHIMTAFVLKETYFSNKKVGLILLDYSNNVEVMYEKLSNSPEFDHVVLIHCKDVWQRYEVQCDRIFRFRYLLNGRKYLERHGIDVSKIEEILFPFKDPIITIIKRELEKLGEKYQCSYYDDGSAAYIEPKNIMFTKPSKIEAIMGVRKKQKYPDKVYMYNPMACKIRNELNILKIELPKSKAWWDRMNVFFGYSGKIAPAKIIFFDQYSEAKDSELEAEDYVDIIKKYFGSEEVMVKKHPKRHDNIYEKNGIYLYPEKQEVPFEICLHNMDNVDSMIFVSDFSTVNLTPKLIYNYEPTVVFLYKILNIFFDSKWYKGMDETVDILKRNYKNPDKVKVLDCIDDLEKIITCKIEGSNYGYEK